jgi:hypothetical protein
MLSRCTGSTRSLRFLAPLRSFPEPGGADWDWLAVEAAAAALQDQGPDEALTRVWEGMPGADLDT